MNIHAASCQRSGGFSSELVESAAQEVRESLTRPAKIATVFCSSDYLPHLEEFCEILRVDGHMIDVVGCTGSGRLSGEDEVEGGQGFSLVAIAHEGACSEILSFRSGQEAQPAPSARSEINARNGATPPSGWLALVDPFVFDVETWLENWEVPVLGGLASGGKTADDCAVFHNGQTADCLVVPIDAPLRLVPVVSQGCRPIGEPLTVTRAENNVIYALGARPAYEALESAFETLSDQEKATARGNLFAGLAGSEYVEDYQAENFLVRNILGADPSSGAVVIGGIPRVGQTLQYQLRDAETASAHLQKALKAPVSEWGKPCASLAFACTGRGKAFFGKQGHDAATVQRALGSHPSAGFFCNGEIGPVGGRNCVHSYTLSCALLYPSSPDV